MAKAFLSLSDTRMRIHRTICWYDDKPYMVEVPELDDSSDYNNEITLYDLNTRSRKRINTKVTDPKFSYKEFPLGYILFEDECMFLSRMPDRKNTQGLSSSVINCTPRSLKWNHRSWFQSQAMYDCLMNNHRTYEEAHKHLADNQLGIKMVPFDRNFAVGYTDPVARTKGLFFRGRQVGTYDWNNSLNINNTPDASYIRVYLQRLGV